MPSFTAFLAGEVLTAGELNAALTAVDQELVDSIVTNVAATQVTSGTTELTLTRLQMPSLAVDSTQLYRTDLAIVSTRTVATDEFAFRIRETTAGSGTIVGEVIMWGDATASRQLRGSIFWSPTATATATYHMSVVRNAGTGTMTTFYTSFGTSGYSSTRTQTWKLGAKTKLRTITV